MIVLYGYPSSEGYNNRRELAKQRLSHIERLAIAGFNVKPFDMGYSKEIPSLNFTQLDKRWKLKDRKLMNLYERFMDLLEGCDVFYNSVGINFHPEFIESVPKFTVFGCNDDPESSALLSKPVARAYDLCAIGNIAELETYKNWGVKHVVWQPMGFSPLMYNYDLTYEQILYGERNINISMVIDKLSHYRKNRLEIIDSAFPNAHFYGRGWRRGYLPSGKEVELFQNTKIGINIHNSTGPINTRLYYLPANGVLQICDNKSYLSGIFEINKEIIGFNDIEECIELCHYYVKHDEERRLIASNGWKRAISEYNEFAVYDRLLVNIAIHQNNTKKSIKKLDRRAQKPYEAFLAKVLNKSDVLKRNLAFNGRKIYNYLVKICREKTHY